MKIGCHCGETISDTTDDLPSKGHLIPDQEWFNVNDALDDEVILPVAAGKMKAKAAFMKSRQIISSRSRLMWQCQACGRIYIDDVNGTLHCYVPENIETARQILRSRENTP